MKKICIFAGQLTVIALLAMTAGCFNSESDYEQIVAENESLVQEIKAAEAEQAVLKTAHRHIKTEMDRLNRLTAGQALVVDGVGVTAAEPPKPKAALSGKTYTVSPGDTLSKIASANKTTSSVLIELNPKLATRPQNMIYENETLVLP